MRNRLRRSVCGVALLGVGVSGFASEPSTRTYKPSAAAGAWEQASRARSVFEAQAAGTRSKAAFTRVLDGFRAIYHDNPRDAHAADAVNAVAEVLAEQGRELDDEKSLHAAIGQYEFLRAQYPASVLRVPALLAEARLERDDLGDGAAAKEKFAEVVKESPHSLAAAEARKSLADVARPTHHDEAVMNGARGLGKEDVPRGLKPAVVAGPDGAAEAAPLQSSAASNKADARNDKKPLASVTGIRHWSTSSYTRVAIDLGDEVKFEAARVPHPDRIFFDLHGARLAQELVGKSFDVTDDGFLKRIRAAQSSGDVTRVVLDVSDVTEYTAFLLPNPYRLIIDIHGGKSQASGPQDREAPVEVAPAAARTASAAANVSGLPAMALTDGGERVRPAVVAAAKEGGRPWVDAHLSNDEAVAKIGHKSVSAKPVPNTVAKPAMSGEVAAVSDAPGKVEATSAPTSKPIVATVKPVDLAAPPTHRDSAAMNGARTVPSSAKTVSAPAKAADKTADGETSLIRALGLKIGRIVIDAGHGGHDSGTLGVDGIQEKDVVLDVALRLGKMLHERLGAEIIYTRSDDTFIPLETRTAIANKAQADLFFSIHANSSPDSAARGVETYYLNFTSDATALDVAARENAVSGASIHQLSDLVKKITLKDKIAESREFAADVEGSLFAGLTRGNSGLRDRGVKKAPFVVLIGANMPSILAEISFVTNAKDAEQLREPDYRQRVAESLFAGVAKYENGLAGVKAGAAPAVKRASLQ